MSIETGYRTPNGSGRSVHGYFGSGRKRGASGWLFSLPNETQARMIVVIITTIMILKMATLTLVPKRLHAARVNNSPTEVA